MPTWLRDVVVTAASAICLAGPVTAIVLPLAPPSWRGPYIAWGVLFLAAALVAWFRKSRRRLR